MPQDRKKRRRLSRQVRKQTKALKTNPLGTNQQLLAPRVVRAGRDAAKTALKQMRRDTRRVKRKIRAGKGITARQDATAIHRKKR